MMGRLTNISSRHSKSYLFLVIIVIISCHIFITDGSKLCEQELLNDNNLSRNKKMATGYAFKSMKMSSLMECMKLCLKFKLCKSISSSEKGEFCNLNVRTDSEASNAVKKRIGTTFINRVGIPSILASGCVNYPCGNESACFVNRKGDVVSVPLFDGMRCKPPPVIDNARMQLEHPLTVGSTVHYFCDKGYNGSGDNMITCMEGMAWSFSTFQCNKICSNTSYTPHKESCYAFKTTLTTWEEAHMNCRNDSADLVSIETEEEFKWIIKNINILHGGDVVQLTTFPHNWTEPVNLAPYGITFVDRTWFSFYVRGCYDAYAHLLVDDTIDGRRYVLCIGCNYDGEITISDVFPDGNRNLLASITTYDLLECEAFKPFWISYENGHIEVGKGLKFGYDKLLHWTSSSPLDIRYVSVTGWATSELKWKVSTGRHYWASGNFNPTNDTDVYVWGTSANAASIDNGFTNWDPESNRTTTDKRCVSLDTQWNKGGTWTNEICSQKYFYICEEGN